MSRSLVTAIGVGVAAVGVVTAAMLWQPAAGSRQLPAGSGQRGAGSGVPAASGHERAGIPMQGEARTANPESRIPNPVDVVTLTPELVARAGIKTATATRGTAIARLHVPGVVQPNAYKNVDATSLVSGRVTQVRAE